MTVKRGAYALVVGGVVWAVVMLAYINTHGPGSYDNKRLLFGFSRDNYLLLLSPSTLLLAYGMTVVRRQFLPVTGRLFALASLGALLLLGLFALGNLVLTVQVGIGGHPAWPDHRPVAIVAGILQALSLPPLGMSLALVSVALLRAQRFRAGAVILLFPLSLIALVPWQPIHSYPGLLFGVGWATLGVLYARMGAGVAGESSSKGLNRPLTRTKV